MREVALIADEDTRQVRVCVRAYVREPGARVLKACGPCVRVGGLACQWEGSLGREVTS